MNKRIPRKPGQPAGSKKHSDLYTDENPKGTIHGLKFASKEDAEKSVNKIKIAENCYPIDTVFGLNIYKATHLKTNQSIYITTSELYK